VNIQLAKQIQPAPSNWRTILDGIGPDLAAESRRSDAANKYVAKNMSALRAHGFLELAVPVELGGGGLSRLELSDMLRRLAHHCSSTALALSMHTHVAATLVWKWQNLKAPVDGLLRRIASERIQLLSSGGSDGLPGSGEAVKVDGGYRVRARKIFASGAPSAQLFVTGAVEHDTPEGPTVVHFVVPMDAKGVSISETWDTLGMRGTASHDVIFDDVFVPDAAIAGRRKAGVWHPLIHIAMMVAIPLVYSVYTGIAESARNIAIQVASKRKKLDINSAGELDTELAATRIALRDMVEFAESAEPGPQTTNAIFIGRSLAARSALKTVELALETAGGVSIFRTVGLERLFRDMQGARFHPLPNSQQRQLAGRMAFGLPIDA
jgi:acyl-CoA dehydrogenase